MCVNYVSLLIDDTEMCQKKPLLTTQKAKKRII